MDLVDSSCVVEQTNRRVAHRTDQRELISLLANLWQRFNEVHSRHFTVDSIKHAANVIRYVVFRIPQIQMTWATLKVKQDDALGFVPARAANSGLICLSRLCLHHLAKGHAQHAGSTNTQDVTTIYTKTTITKVFTFLSGNT